VPNEEQEEEIANPTEHETVSSDKQDEMRPRRFKTLREIYETTNELHMVCLLTQTKSRHPSLWIDPYLPLLQRGRALAV